MRAIWKGSLNFGLVTIPVKLYSATENHDVSLHQVHEADGGRIHYRRICEVCGQSIDYGDIAKADGDDDVGNTVMLTDDDFASLPADHSREIAVQEFVPTEQIDPLLFDKSYFVEPDKGGAKAYVLLRRTLENTERVAIVQFALRQRTQLGVLRVHGDALAVQMLRWPDELRSFEIELGKASATDREMDMAATLVDSYASDFDPSEFTDEYQVQLRELIDTKLESGETYSPAESDDTGEDAEVVDLLAALERSVDTQSGGKKSGRKGSGKGSGEASGSKNGKKPASRKQSGRSSGSSPRRRTG